MLRSLGWRKRQTPDQELPTGYRVPDVPVEAEVDLRSARRGFRGERLFAAVVAVNAGVGLLLSMRDALLGRLPLFAPIHLGWLAYTAFVFRKAVPRLRRVRVLGDGSVEVVPLRGARRRGRLWLERKPLFGLRGRKKAWELRIGLDDEPRPLDVIRGDRLDATALAMLVQAATRDERVPALRLLFGFAAVGRATLDDTLPPARAPSGPLTVRARVRFWRGRGLPPFALVFLPSLVGVATGVAAGTGAASPWAAVAGFLAGTAVVLGWNYVRYDRLRDVELARERDTVAVRLRGVLLGRLPATPEALIPTLGRKGLSGIALQDAGGTTALVVLRPTMDVAAEVRGLFARASPRVRVVTAEARDAACGAEVTLEDVELVEPPSVNAPAGAEP
ncbi:MAG: hypothetical protein AAGH15_12780 [Myxococcota bacterium]